MTTYDERMEQYSIANRERQALKQEARNMELLIQRRYPELDCRACTDGEWVGVIITKPYLNSQPYNGKRPKWHIPADDLRGMDAPMITELLRAIVNK